MESAVPRWVWLSIVSVNVHLLYFDNSSNNYTLCFCQYVLFTIINEDMGYNRMVVQSMVFESFNVQAGTDRSGVQTDMLTLNSTVRIYYRNPATFFGVHVTATPLELHYYMLKVASGQVSHII